MKPPRNRSRKGILKWNQRYELGKTGAPPLEDHAIIGIITRANSSDGGYDMKKILGPLIFALMLSGCAMTLPLSGQTENGDETFTGKATGYMDGGGNLELSSSKGMKCNGTFVYVTSRNGEGTFTCSNGQSGSFTFVSTGTRGTGKGTIGSRRFTFTFG